MRRQTLFESLEMMPFEDEEQERSWQENALKIIKDLISSRLTWRQKEIIMLYYYKGLRQREIASVLGISESAVSHTKHTALKRLKKDLDLIRR